MNQSIGEKDYKGTPLFIEDVVAGNFIKKRYIKCPHMSKQCTWRMSKEHLKGYEFLNDSCYLSGSFKFECPE